MELITQTQTSSDVIHHLPVRRDSLTQWYLGPRVPGDQISSTDVVKQAYSRALEFHQSAFGTHNANTWISKASSVQDVMNVLAEAQRLYDTKKSKRWKSVAVVVSWWRMVSSRMMQYEKVIDTIVSSNPEYAALLWGAMKFLFTVTLRHEELSSRIAQAFAEIGAVLPEVNFIAEKLYPVDGIQMALANAYAQIIEFCIRATKWYEQIRRNPVKRVFGPITKSWPLEFQDIRANVDGHFRRLRELSTVAHQAETRAIHTKIAEIRILLDQSSVQQGFGPEATTLRLNPSVTSSLPFIRERIKRYLVGNTIQPHQVLQIVSAMRDRRRARGAVIPPATWGTTQLQDWISKPESAFLQLQGSSLRAEQSRDFALDILDLLKLASLPVIWYLGSTSSTSISIVDVLRSLIEQITENIHDPDNCWLNHSHFQACKTDKDWLNLFVSVLSLVPRIVIVIDTHQGVSEMGATICQFWDTMKEQKSTTIVKMLMLNYGATDRALERVPVLKANIDAGKLPVVMGVRARARPTRVLSRFQGRGTRVRSPQTMGPEQLKPFVLQFANMNPTG